MAVAGKEAMGGALEAREEEGDAEEMEAPQEVAGWAQVVLSAAAKGMETLEAVDSGEAALEAVAMAAVGRAVLVVVGAKVG